MKLLPGFMSMRIESDSLRADNKDRTMKETAEIKMKTLELGGISYIRLVPGCESEWYYGLSFQYGDLYEAEEIIKDGRHIDGRDLYLIHYPDGIVYKPITKQQDSYPGEPVYLDHRIYMLNVDFTSELIQILEFNCDDHKTALCKEFPLGIAKDCYNLSLTGSPLTLSRQNAGSELDILYPERIRMPLAPNESFYLRDNDRFFFSAWYEDPDYREETIVKDLNGEMIERYRGSVYAMPDGHLWFLK